MFEKCFMKLEEVDEYIYSINMLSGYFKSDRQRPSIVQ